MTGWETFNAFICIATGISRQRGWEVNTALSNFLSGSGADHAGRTYQDILDQDDQWLEYTHDWIQWCFPLFEPSQSVMSAPVLESMDEVKLIQESAEAQEYMRRGLVRFAEFLRDGDQWLRYHDHNHLRITRVIKSVKTLMSDDQAREFYQYVMSQVGNRAGQKPSEVSMQYWTQAAASANVGAI